MSDICGAPCVSSLHSILQASLCKYRSKIDPTYAYLIMMLWDSATMTELFGTA